jgi:hypothetical protein
MLIFWDGGSTEEDFGKHKYLGEDVCLLTENVEVYRKSNITGLKHIYSISEINFPTSLKVF